MSEVHQRQCSGPSGVIQPHHPRAPRSYEARERARERASERVSERDRQRDRERTNRSARDDLADALGAMGMV
jgi:hypothetical protein